MQPALRITEETESRSRRDVDDADLALLKLRHHPASDLEFTGHPIRAVDLFSGCGGMTVGAELGALETGHAFESVLSMDLDEAALEIHHRNFPDGEVDARPVEARFDGALDDPLTFRERKTRKEFADIDLLMGGPPCQGHSNLNNHTRRKDPRNALYARMARAARVLRPSVVVIENVASVIHDRGGVVDATVKALVRQKYRVGQVVVPMVRVGVPQLRKRHVLIATRLDDLDPHSLLHELATNAFFDPPRELGWAIGDLSRRRGKTVFDTASTPSPENQRRMDYLFEHDLDQLPNPERPPCHQDGNHSYYSIYGRMKWDSPAQTITTGFGSMGQGCYVHPRHARTITPHEAARIQTFPDYFDFGKDTRRTVLAKVIGNAVPPFFMREVTKRLLPHLG